MYTVYLYSISSSPILLIFLAALCFLTHLLFVSSFSPDFCVLCCLFLCHSLVVACMSTSMCLWYIIYIHINIYIYRERESSTTLHIAQYWSTPSFLEACCIWSRPSLAEQSWTSLSMKHEADLNILLASKQIHARNTLEIWHLWGIFG